MYPGTYSAAAAITLATVSFGLGAFAQNSVRTPDLPPFQTFVPNAEEQTFIRVGPFSGTGEAGVGYSYTDNANTTLTDKLSRNQFFENLDLDLNWILSPFNRIDVRLGGQLQENFYSNGHNAVNLAVRPGTEIELEAKAGQFQFRAFERFSLVQDPVSDPSVANQENLNRLINTIGIGVDLPFYRGVAGLEFAYTYSDNLSSSVPTGSAGGGLLNSLHLGGKVSFELTPTLSYGLEVNTSYNAGGGASDFYVFSAGPFLKGHITPLLEVDAGVGPLLSAGPAGQPPEYYAFLEVRHQLSRIVQVLAGISHDSIFSSGLGVTQDNNIHLRAQALLTRNLTVTVGPYVNFGTVVSGELPGAFTQYGVTADSVFRFNKHLSAALAYRFVKREGDQSADRYTQNLVSVSLNYGF